MKQQGKYAKWLTEEGLTLVAGWARSGLSDEQIAHNMGIAYSTFRVWRDKFPELATVLAKTKEVVDLEVENALYKRAIGYDSEETIIEQTDGGKKHVKKIRKHIPGDTVAQIFWLKNRRPDKWRDKPENVTTEAYEDDGLLAALDAKIDDSDDDSWMLEEGENNETC